MLYNVYSIFIAPQNCSTIFFFVTLSKKRNIRTYARVVKEELSSSEFSLSQPLSTIKTCNHFFFSVLLNYDPISKLVVAYVICELYSSIIRYIFIQSLFATYLQEKEKTGHCYIDCSVCGWNPQSPFK